MYAGEHSLQRLKTCEPVKPPSNTLEVVFPSRSRLLCATGRHPLNAARDAGHARAGATPTMGKRCPGVSCGAEYRGWYTTGGASSDSLVALRSSRPRRGSVAAAGVVFMPPASAACVCVRSFSISPLVRGVWPGDRVTCGCKGSACATSSGPGARRSGGGGSTHLHHPASIQYH